MGILHETGLQTRFGYQDGQTGQQAHAVDTRAFKHVTKESDLVASREWFLEYTRQLHKMRMIATGGVLK
jgi:hypothetical protein